MPSFVGRPFRLRGQHHGRLPAEDRQNDVAAGLEQYGSGGVSSHAPRRQWARTFSTLEDP
jgi:hypothetical protein